MVLVTAIFLDQCCYEYFEREATILILLRSFVCRMYCALQPALIFALVHLCIIETKCYQISQIYLEIEVGHSIWS